MKIEFPWPPSELNPNSRPNRFVKARKVKQYRHDCAWLTKQALGRTRLQEPFLCTITFHPTNNLWDDDNAIAAFKAGRDGMCKALGINDRNLRPQYIHADPVKGGKVVVILMSQTGDNFEVVGQG